MYAPPPPPSLSRAEIEARRKRMQVEARQSAETGRDPKLMSRNADAPASTTRLRRASEESHGGSIMRKIASFGVGRDRDKNKEPAVRAFDISAPLPSTPPLTSLPAIPQFSPIMAPLSDPPARPLPQPEIKRQNRGEGGSRVTSNESGLSSSTTTSHGSSRIPKRPPRPTSSLVLESQFPGYDAFVKCSSASSSPPVSEQIVRTASTRSHLSTPSNALSRSPENESRLARIIKSAKRPARLNEESLKPFGKDNTGPGRRLSNRGMYTSPSSMDAAMDDTPSNTVPAPMSRQDKVLPETPWSILQTPEGLYGAGGKSFKTIRGPGRKAERSSVKSAKRNSRKPRDSCVEEISPLELSTVHDSKRKAKSKVLPSLEAISPVRRHTHLRGGSIIIVSPPEADAWHRRSYVQGPIRLLKPSTMPRKDSVASLEPFQNAIDKIFKDGESVTRRQSELAMTEDICTFFLEFALGDWPYEGGVLASGGATESSESDQGSDSDEASEQSDILPDSPTVWRAPPVEDEESLRVKGIEWLGRQRMRSIATEEEEQQQQQQGKDGVSTMPQAEDNVLSSSTNTSDANVEGQVVNVSHSIVRMDDAAAAPWIKSVEAENAQNKAVPRRRSQ